MPTDNEEVLDFIDMQLSELIELKQQITEMKAALEDALELCHDIILNGNVDWKILGAIANMIEQTLTRVKED